MQNQDEFRLHPEKVSYYEAIELADSMDSWRLPSAEEAKVIRDKMLKAGQKATALWTATWRDNEVSYVVDFKTGELVECYAVDHFADLDYVLVRQNYSLNSG